MTSKHELAEQFGIHFEENPSKVKKHLENCIRNRLRDNKELADEYLQEFRDEFDPDNFPFFNIDYIPSKITVSDKMTEGKGMTSVTGYKSTFRINFAEWFLMHKELEPDDIHDLICHMVAHIIQKIEKDKPVTMAHDDDWKRIVRVLGCNESELCKPAKFLTMNEIAENLPQRERRGKVARDSSGKIVPKWKAKCPNGCEFGVARWVNKAKVPKCQSHNLACTMYERKGKSGNYQEEPFQLGFGFNLEAEPIKVRDKLTQKLRNAGPEDDLEGELLVQDEETGEFRVAREIVAENPKFCSPIHEF